MSRNTLTLTSAVTISNHTSLGYNLLSPALVGKPLTVSPAVDLSSGDSTMISKLVDWFINDQARDGISLDAMEKAPVLLVIEVLKSIKVTAPSATDILLDLGFQLNIPGAALLIPFDIPTMVLTLSDDDGVQSTIATLKIDISFLKVAVDLSVQIKDANMRCNVLLSLVAFNTAGTVKGNLKVGATLAAFPVVLDMKAGLWASKSVMDQASTSVSQVTFDHDANGWCGFSGARVGSSVCNRQGTSIKAELTQVTASVIASGGVIADPLILSLPLSDASISFDDGDCVPVESQYTSSYSSVAAHNASCHAHRTSGATTQGLGLGYFSISVQNMCTCKSGINQCTHTDDASKWACDAAGAQLKLCQSRSMP